MRWWTGMAWLDGDNWRGYVTLVMDAFEEEKEAYHAAVEEVEEHVDAVNEVLDEAWQGYEQGEAVEDLVDTYEPVVTDHWQEAQKALVGKTYHDRRKIGKERTEPLRHKHYRFEQVLESHGKLHMKLDRFRHRNWTLRDEMESLQQQIKMLEAQYVELEDTVQNLQYVQDNLPDIIRDPVIDEGTVDEITKDLPKEPKKYGYLSASLLQKELNRWREHQDEEERDPDPAPSA